MKVATFNINNVNKRLPNLLTWLYEARPEIMCLQELKASREDVHRMYFEDRQVNTLDFVAAAYRDDITIEGGIRRITCAGLCYHPDEAPPVDEHGDV